MDKIQDTRYIQDTDIATTRKNWPKGRFFENLSYFLGSKAIAMGVFYGVHFAMEGYHRGQYQ